LEGWLWDSRLGILSNFPLYKQDKPLPLNSEEGWGFKIQFHAVFISRNPDFWHLRECSSSPTLYICNPIMAKSLWTHICVLYTPCEHFTPPPFLNSTLGDRGGGGEVQSSPASKVPFSSSSPINFLFKSKRSSLWECASNKTKVCVQSWLWSRLRTCFIARRVKIPTLFYIGIFSLHFPRNRMLPSADYTIV
jgi:hypothetical protein